MRPRYVPIHTAPAGVAIVAHRRRGFLSRAARAAADMAGALLRFIRQSSPWN